MSSTRKAKTKKQEAAEDGEDPQGDAGASPPKASKRTKKASGPEGPEEVGNGWVLHPPSLIFRKGIQKGNKKIAAFDLDDTLVFPKGRRKFNLEPDEWKFFNKQVKSKLTELSEQGHKLVVFSNQGGIKKALKGKAAEKVRARVDNIIKELELDVQVFLATMDDDNRKPGVGMWEFMAQQHNGGVEPDVSKCFFVGDAAGRPQDFAATDKEFAEAIGIEFKTPDDVFGKPSKVVKQDVQAKEENTLNSDVVEALSDLVQAIQEHSTSDKKGFKIAAFNKAIAAISRFDKRITKSNLKELGALQGVGKGTIAKVDEFLCTGKIAEVEELMGEDAAEDLRKAKAAEAKVKSGAMKFL